MGCQLQHRREIARPEPSSTSLPCIHSRRSNEYTNTYGHTKPTDEIKLYGHCLQPMLNANVTFKSHDLRHGAADDLLRVVHGDQMTIPRPPRENLNSLEPTLTLGHILCKFLFQCSLQTRVRLSSDSDPQPCHSKPTEDILEGHGVSMGGELCPPHIQRSIRMSTMSGILQLYISICITCIACVARISHPSLVIMSCYQLRSSSHGNNAICIVCSCTYLGTYKQCCRVDVYFKTVHDRAILSWYHRILY